MGTSYVQRRSPRLPVEVPFSNKAVQARDAALLPWWKFPREQAYILRLGKSESLARKRRSGERPTSLIVYAEWLEACARVNLVRIGRESLQKLADLIDHDVRPRSKATGRSAAQEVSDVARTTGEALAKFTIAMDDGEISKDEARELIPYFETMRDELTGAIAALRVIAEEEEESDGQ